MIVRTASGARDRMIMILDKMPAKTTIVGGDDALALQGPPTVGPIIGYML